MKKLFLLILILGLMVLEENSAQKDIYLLRKGKKQTIVKNPTEIIDSLKSELSNAKNEKQKVELSINIADKYLSLSADSSISYANNALQIAEKFQLNDITANCYWIFAKAYGKKKNMEEVKRNLDKSMGIFEKTNNEIGIAKCNWTYGNYYDAKKDYNLANNYYLKAIESFKKNGKRDLEIEVYLNQGNLFKRQNNIDTAKIGRASCRERV